MVLGLLSVGRQKLVPAHITMSQELNCIMECTSHWASTMASENRWSQSGGGLWRPRCYIRITTSNIESTSCILLKCLIDLYMYQRPSMLCCSIMGYYTYSRLLATLGPLIAVPMVLWFCGREMHWLQDWRSEGISNIQLMHQKGYKAWYNDFPWFSSVCACHFSQTCQDFAKDSPTLLWEASGPKYRLCVHMCACVCFRVPGHVCLCGRISLRVHVVGFACLHHLLSILRYPRSCHLPEQGCAHFGSNEALPKTVWVARRTAKDLSARGCMPCPYSWQFKLKGQVNVSCYIFTFHELSCFEWFAGLLTATHHAPKSQE